jgi:hypothetical protein
MVKRIGNLGLTSDMAYIAAISSVVLSIVMWFRNRGDDPAHAERFGIFVGLWAPTLAILGHALEENERQLMS